MKLMEFFFQPEAAKGTDKHHYRRNMKMTNNMFPYMDEDEEQRVSEDKIEEELGIEGGE